jgi:O-antigen ligase
MPESFNLDKTYQYLLIALAFLLPLTVFGGNVVVVLIVVLWLISGNYKNKINEIFSNKLMISSIVFFSLHVIGLIWTEDLKWGLHIVHKMWYFLLLYPILFTIVKKKYIKYYITSFLFAITLTEVVSYLVWFEILPPFKNATVINPTPFMSHVSYNPILAFAIYLVMNQTFFNSKLSKPLFLLYSFFAVTMSINMFITGGRSGQVMFFVMITILIIQFFSKQKVKALLGILILIPGIFFIAYQTSSLFEERVDLATYNIINYSDNKGSSAGLRITISLNSWSVMKENLLFGIGTGDFPNEYRKINQINTPQLPVTTNPHNMYTLIGMQLGLVGLISMFSIFYLQIKRSLVTSNKFIRDVGLVLPILFLVIMWSDSYLLGHYTTLLFVFFSSFLHKDFDKIE